VALVLNRAGVHQHQHPLNTAEAVAAATAPPIRGAVCSSAAVTSMGLNPESARRVAINNWTLKFSDPHLEQQFRVHQLQAWGCTKLWRLKMNLLAAVVNFSITIYMLSMVSHDPPEGCVRLGTPQTSLCQTGHNNWGEVGAGRMMWYKRKSPS
jgi:hypothetical protein